MGNAASWAGVIIGAGSLCVAVVALVKSSRAQHKASAAQQRIVEIAEQRERDRRSQAFQAILHPELRSTAKHTYRLYLVNHGAAEARNIRIEMDGRPLLEHPAAVSNDPMPDFVGPHSEISCLLGLHMGCSPPFRIGITWADDSGQDRTYDTALTG